MFKLNRIYCDHNATTPIHPKVQEAYIKALSIFGNASSLYFEGRIAKEALEKSREILGEHLHVDPYNIIFTSSGTEGNNQVLRTLINQKIRSNSPVHVMVSRIDHASVCVTAELLKMYGIELDWIPVDGDGKVKEADYRALFKPQTKLVSIILANNEIGTVQDMKKLTRIAHEKGVLCHTDAVQALGKIPLNLPDLGVDFMSLSAHKVYAPKGIGALYIKNDETVQALLTGGNHERYLRASTENVPGAVAFAEAVKQVNVEQYNQHIRPLSKKLKEGLSLIKDSQFNSPDKGLCNTVSVSFKEVDGHGLAINCDLEGINVSTGSACSAGSIELSPVLKAIGISDALNVSTLRFSLGLTNTENEISQIIDKITSLVHHMREKK